MGLAVEVLALAGFDFGADALVLAWLEVEPAGFSLDALEAAPVFLGEVLLLFVAGEALATWGFLVAVRVAPGSFWLSGSVDVGLSQLGL